MGTTHKAEGHFKSKWLFCCLLPTDGSKVTLSQQMQTSMAVTLNTDLQPLMLSSQVPDISITVSDDKKVETQFFETQPHTPMWAAFWTGSAGRRWAGRCGHRLTAHNIGRGSRRQAASTPDTRHLQSTRTRLLLVATIAHCASFRHRKCLCLRLWFAIYGVAGAHTARSVAIGYRLHKLR